MERDSHIYACIYIYIYNFGVIERYHYSRKKELFDGGFDIHNIAKSRRSPALIYEFK